MQVQDVLGRRRLSLHVDVDDEDVGAAGPRVFRDLARWPDEVRRSHGNQDITPFGYFARALDGVYWHVLLEEHHVRPEQPAAAFAGWFGRQRRPAVRDAAIEAAYLAEASVQLDDIATARALV